MVITLVNQDKNYNLNKDYSNFNFKGEIKRQLFEEDRWSLNKDHMSPERILGDQELQDYKEKNGGMRNVLKKPNSSLITELSDATKIPLADINLASRSALVNATKSPLADINLASRSALINATKNPLADSNQASRSAISNSLPSLGELSKVDLIARSFKQQVSIFENNNQLSPLLDDISQNTKYISEHIKNSKVDFLKLPTSTEVVINRLNKLPSDYHLMIPPLNDAKRTTENKEDIYLENKRIDTKVPLKSTISSLGILDIVKSITVSEVMDFYNYLEKYPMLGLHHKIGKRILEWVKSVPLLSLKKNTYHYRARMRPLHQERPFTESEMWEAPHGIPGQGRYNSIGQSVLYTSNLPDAAAAEIIKENQEEKVDIIKWSLTEEINVLDMPNKDYPLFQFCQFSSTSETDIKPEYLIPNFLSQCCQIQGVVGLRFKSNTINEAYNYTFFDYPKSWFEFQDQLIDFNGN